MTVEDFTTYTEVDPNNHLSRTAKRISIAGLIANESCYIYKDKGIGFFSGDFKHRLDMKFTTKGYDSELIPWALWNTIGDRYECEAAGSDGIYIRFYPVGFMRVRIVERYNGTTYESGYRQLEDDLGISIGDPFYITVTRRGDKFSAYFHADKDIRDRCLGGSGSALSLTLHSIEAYRYIYGAQSASTGGSATTIDAIIENLEFVSPLFKFYDDAETGDLKFVNEYQRGDSAWNTWNFWGRTGISTAHVKNGLFSFRCFGNGSLKLVNEIRGGEPPYIRKINYGAWVKMTRSDGVSSLLEIYEHDPVKGDYIIRTLRNSATELELRLPSRAGDVTKTGSCNFPLNEWHWLETQIHRTSDGYACVWLDDVKVIEITGYDWSGEYMLEDPRFGLCLNAAGVTRQWEVFFDDFYVEEGLPKGVQIGPPKKVPTRLLPSV